MPEKGIQVDFEPVGRRVQIEAGTDLLEAARQAGVQLSSVCGGIGVCDSCRVRVMSGKVSPLSLEEEAGLSATDLEGGYRLACQTIPFEDVKVHIPAESLAAPQRLQVEGQAGGQVPVEPALSAWELALDPPSLEDLRSDSTRLADYFSAQGAPVRVGVEVWKKLPQVLRACGWKARLALRTDAQGSREAAGALAPGNPIYGFAVDVGSTKLAAYLVDLESGKTVASQGAMNPQIAYGEDVVSRIAYANVSQAQADVLREKLVEALNGLLEEVCRAAGAATEQVVDAVLVGNTAMHHLMLGLPARSLGEAPYVPVVSAAMDVQAQEFGLQLSAGAHVYIPPNIAGYVGADHVAMVLASEMWASDQPVLALDIGTNTEIALAYGERLLCCSTASGPVFEGAHIQDGMRAAPGAIERVRWLEGKLHIQTIDNLPAVGICGSGILDAVAALLSTGAIEASGKLKRDHPLVDRDGREPGVVLATSIASGHGREVRVTRRDIHEIQLAKGAIRAGVELLLREAGLAADDLDQIVVAGAFGTYLDIPSAIQVGMFPDLPVDRIHQVGNAAGVGARQMIVSAQRRKQAEEIARRMEYIELTTHPGFTPEFIQQMYF